MGVPEVSQQVSGGSGFQPCSVKLTPTCHHHRVNIYSQTTGVKTIHGERVVFSTHGAGKTGPLLTHTQHRLKMDRGPNCKTLISQEN